MVWQPEVESRPHPFGEAGVRSSLEEVCKRAAHGASEILSKPDQLARVRTYAAKILKEAKSAGRQVHRPGHRARELLLAAQERKLWIPDPIGIEYIPAAHLMACDGDVHEDGTPCFAGDDCDGKVVLLAAMYMSVGLYTMIVGHSYDSSGMISHVLTKVYFDGRWHYADPSQLSNGTHQALGKCVPYTRERYYSMPEIKVVCDGESCDTRNFDPEDVGFVKTGKFVGVNGIVVIELPPEVAVRWLGDDPTKPPETIEACKTVPWSLDKFTLEKYAERCGTQLALKWASNELGVDTSGCNSKGGARGAADCVASNYGATLDLVDKDGNINWHAVVQDAGAVGGVIVCSAVGAEIAAATCGKIGAQIAQVIETIVVDVGKFVIDLFWGGSDGGGWACGKYPFHGVPLPQMARDIAAFMKSAKTYGLYPTETLIGPPIFATLAHGANMSGMRYWSRLLTLRGLAQASAILGDAIAQKTGATMAQGIQAIAPVAPHGWTELVRPELRPTTKGSVDDASPTPDYRGNAGGLLTAITEPDVIPLFTGMGVQPVVPRWQLPEYWAGVPQPAAGDLIWRYFMVLSGCPNDTVVWGDVVDSAKVIERLNTLPGAPGHDQHQSYILYSVPKDIESMITDLDNQSFLILVDLWRKSLVKDMPKKLERARSLATSSSSSGVAPLVGVAAAAGALWLGWRFFFA